MDVKEEIKNKLSIEDVIGAYLELKRAGRNYKARSPFTNEKTPSFIVSPEKQIWHDFSSSKGGDIFSFVMEVEGVDFKTALEILARKAGVEVIEFSSNKNAIKKERLYQANSLIARFYQIQFSKNKLALEYVLKTRKISKNTALDWKLGYSPNTGNAAITYLRKKGFNDREINLAGLSSRSNNNYVDIFRGRLMIPLCDPQGRIIGFTARSLTSNDFGPKYINTPRTTVYDKSRHIFGLEHAKEAIRESGFVVITEGNLDVISSHQAKIKEVVATAGTAITESHLKGLSFLTSDVRLCFDSDRAGVDATIRAIILASKLKINLSVISLINAKDPDEQISKDSRTWQKVINNPTYALDWYIKYLSNNLDLGKPQNKRLFSDKIIEVLRNLEDEVEVDHYVNLLAKLLDVSNISINKKLNKNLNSSENSIKKVIASNLILEDKPTIEEKKTEDNFISLILERKTLREFLEFMSAEMFIRNENKEIFEILQKDLLIEVNTKKEIFIHLENYVKIEKLLYEELYQDLGLNELHYEALRLRSKIVDNYVKRKKKKIGESLREDIKSSKIQELLNQARSLDQLLRKINKEDKHEI